YLLFFFTIVYYMFFVHPFLFMIPRQPRSTLFPYTTLFRSLKRKQDQLRGVYATRSLTIDGKCPFEEMKFLRFNFNRDWQMDVLRSEEHTSELQSRENLVCRLLLEKKKHIQSSYINDTHSRC